MTPTQFCHRHLPEGLIALFLLVGLLAVSGAVGGEAGSFLVSALDVGLFVVLALLACLGERRHPAFRWLAGIWLLLLIGSLGAVTSAIGILSVVPPGWVESGAASPETLDPAVLLQGALMMLGVLVAALISLVGLSREFRLRLSRYLPFNPDSFVHTMGLVVIIALILIPPVPLLVTGTAPYLSPGFMDIIAASGDLIADSVQLDVYSLFWTLLGSFIIAGACVRRSARETFIRLGLLRPTGKEIVLAVAAGLALVLVFTAVDAVIAALWGYLGWPVTDSEAVGMLFAGFLTPLGIIVASVSAGLGEEVSIRGLLQPRFGMLLPALLFASLHAFQYGWDALLSVFIAGIIFAYIRAYSNTTTSAIVHTVYDLVLFSLLLAGM